MKRRLSAVLLATGLSLSVFAAGVHAEETEIRAAAESVSEAVTESLSEAETEAVTESQTGAEESVSEAVTESQTGAEESASEAVTESQTGAEEGVSEAVTESPAETESLSEAESVMEEIEQEAESELTAAESEEVLDTAGQVKLYMEQYCSQLSVLTDEQLQSMVDNGDETSALLAYTWQSVKGSLGNFVSLETPEVTVGTTSLEAVARATYDGVDEDTVVEVSFNMNQDGTFTMDWNVEYPMSTLLEQAGLNTLMGLGIVFLVLFFLSWLIGRLHIIPDMVEGRVKEKVSAPVPAPAPAAAPVPAPVYEEEELVDDGELVAVIAAAIAASENTSTDGFVVRSIRKANKKNWQRA